MLRHLTKFPKNKTNEIYTDMEEKYGKEIARIIRIQFGLSPNDSSNDHVLLKLNNDAVFSEVLKWKGVGNLNCDIRRWIKHIFHVTLDD